MLIANESLIDCHMHMVASPHSILSRKHGNIIKTSIFSNISHTILSLYHGLDLRSKDLDYQYPQYVNQLIDESQYVKKGIIFGLDGVYDDAGYLDVPATSFMITNDFVKEVIRPFKNLKYGASISLSRRDAMEVLDKAKSDKAALIKVLPNVQGFDPADKKYSAFYKKMADYKIPLLIHSGYEFALPSIRQSYGHPNGFRLALDSGVTVIAAHGCATGLMSVELFKGVVREYVKKYKNFYLDISAVTIPTRSGIVSFLRENEDVRERLVFGTDFPLPVVTSTFLLSVGKLQLRKINRNDNYFDRYVELMKALELFIENNPKKKNRAPFR